MRLLAVHGLSPDSVRHIDEVGGLPCPSLAVISDEIGFDEFGPINLIAPKSMLNPKKYRTYDADVYTKVPLSNSKARY